MAGILKELIDSTLLEIAFHLRSHFKSVDLSDDGVIDCTGPIETRSDLQFTKFWVIARDDSLMITFAWTDAFPNCPYKFTRDIVYYYEPQIVDRVLAIVAQRKENPMSDLGLVEK